MAGRSLLGFTVVQGIVQEEATYLKDLTSSLQRQVEQRLASRTTQAATAYEKSVVSLGEEEGFKLSPTLCTT
jgi:hypothetical protein